MDNDPEKKSDDWATKRRIESFQELIQLLNNFLPFSQWGFQQSYSMIAVQFPPYVIYDSEWCRVKFALGPGERHRGPELSVYYGRLHAPNDQNIFMMWNGEQCYAWHEVYQPLNFLDGHSPQEAVDQWRPHRERPQIVEQFMQSDISKRLSPDGFQHPEWAVRLHATIWKHYSKRLFELFDLRQSTLWNEYARFILEYHKIRKSRVVPGLPPSHNIC